MLPQMQRLFRPSQCIAIATSEKMCSRQSRLRKERQGIEWVEAQRAFVVFDHRHLRQATSSRSPSKSRRWHSWDRGQRPDQAGPPPPQRARIRTPMRILHLPVPVGPSCSVPARGGPVSRLRPCPGFGRGSNHTPYAARSRAMPERGARRMQRRVGQPCGRARELRRWFHLIACISRPCREGSSRTLGDLR